MLAGCDQPPAPPAPPPKPVSPTQSSALSKDVSDFLQRRTNCRHWAGEEAYDAARRAEINAAYAKLRCATLEADEEALKRRYGGNPALVRALDAAKKQQP
jgi:hypothetical protein